MSKITDIKYKIDQLDGGTFQNLCDTYLRCRGYGTGYSLGMNTGTNKTAKGNPDTYFRTADNKYVFVMYTTQKSDFVSKALEDFEKCFDASKTGLPSEDVVEIIFCHTYGRLSPGEDKKLHEFCENHNAILTLIGLDILGEDLYYKYPRLAKEFLAIDIDTGQISNIYDFVCAHDSNRMSAPLHTEFLLREQELTSAKEKLNQQDILIISGSAGTGKTRLALQLCEEISNEIGYEVLCIKNRGLEIYDDLRGAIEQDKPYLFFIDDANELTELHLVLDFFARATTSPYGIKKIIMTVRDYARQSVIQQVLKVTRPEILRLELLKDEDITKLIENIYNIKNSIYLDRIVDIAAGNPRLAMLAGKLASESQNIESIRDVSQLYDNYYGTQTKKIANSATEIISAGILAFFEVLHFGNLEKMGAIFAACKITQEQFVSDLKQLHELELVDLCHDMAAKISDQSFSNYLVKHVFIDKQYIPLSQMIETGFCINKAKTILACNTLSNVFSTSVVHTYIFQQINIVWDHLVGQEIFPEFLKAFPTIRPTETLLMLQEVIEKEEIVNFDVHSVTLDSDNLKNIEDDTIKMLCGFVNTQQISDAIDLLLLYYKKRPDLIEQIYTAFVSRIGFSYDSWEYDYFSQLKAAERLCSLIAEESSDNNLFLFVNVNKHYMKLKFSGAESGRGRTFRFYTISLTANECVLRYRKILLEQLLIIYKSGKYCIEIEDFLMKYVTSHIEESGVEIIKCELEYILDFFSVFSEKDLFHCVIAQKINNIIERAGNSKTEILAPFLASHKYEIYSILLGNYRGEEDWTYQQYKDRHKVQVEQLVKDYDITKFICMFNVCNESCRVTKFSNHTLALGIEYAMEMFSNDSEMYIGIIKTYIEKDTPYDVNTYNIYKHLFSILSPEKVMELITSCSFAQQNVWIWRFFEDLPEKYISSEWVDKLLGFLKTPSKFIRSTPYRNLAKLKKYECVEQEIIIKASRIIAEHYDDSPFVFNLYFESLIYSPEKMIELYRKDLSLLEYIYLKNISDTNHADHEGKLLAEILKYDPDFLFLYLSEYLQQRHNCYCDDIWMERLQVIWEFDDYLEEMNKISDYILKETEYRSYPYSSMICNLLFSPKIDTIERQEAWIQSVIEVYSQDSQRMYCLFSALEEHNSERRRKALEKLLQRNPDWKLFETLPLEASHWGGTGSMIPYMQERISYLTSLLPMLSGLKFLRHKQRVENDIRLWETRIRAEEIEELLRSV